MLEAFARYPVFDNLVFWIGGPAFPSSLLILGIVLAATKKAPVWKGVMIAISTALFPVSRIFRVEWMAHADDLLILIPSAYIGNEIINKRLFKPLQSA
ncbi:MAG TPA: hypothetical protein VHC47_10725 [Mucilaginibacter sp.]|nr:hypothetical protein [Mucilaginibacter sp.]